MRIYQAKKAIIPLLKKSKKRSKKETTKKLSFGILDLFIVVVVVSIISCVSTGFILNYQYKKATAKYLSSLETDGNLAEMIKVYNDINNNYYENIIYCFKCQNFQKWNYFYTYLKKYSLKNI